MVGWAKSSAATVAAATARKNSLNSESLSSGASPPSPQVSHTQNNYNSLTRSSLSLFSTIFIYPRSISLSLLFFFSLFFGLTNHPVFYYSVIFIIRLFLILSIRFTFVSFPCVAPGCSGGLDKPSRFLPTRQALLLIFENPRCCVYIPNVVARGINLVRFCFVSAIHLIH